MKEVTGLAKAAESPSWHGYESAIDQRDWHDFERSACRPFSYPSGVYHPVYQAMGEAHYGALAIHRLLATALALREYQADHGTFPGSLEALAPEYLDKIPKDPFSSDGEDIRLQRWDGRLVLYSLSAEGTKDWWVPPEDTAPEKWIANEFRDWERGLVVVLVE